MPKTEAQKRAMKKWIEKNKEHYREMQNGYAKEFYEKNREEILAKKKVYYIQKKLKKEQEKNEQELVEE